jgi:pimeloyl-ACP methyl ester carboxylesterase
MPTLIMVGSEDKPRPPHEAHQMANLIPNAQLDIIPGAGHISNLEQPGYVNTKLLGFLKDILSKTDGYTQLAAV